LLTICGHRLRTMSVIYCRREVGSRLNVARLKYDTPVSYFIALGCKTHKRFHRR
jgi:hypothetical protein